jgi:uncharacterized protein (TIGR02246 family)
MIENPEQTHERFAAAANAADLEAVVALYETDGVVVERDGGLTQGTDAIRRHVQDLLTLRPRMEILSSRSFQNGDLALLCSEWRARVATPEGKEATMRFRGSEIVRRQEDGLWRLVLDNPWGIEASG